MSSTCTDVVHFDIVNSINLFSFPSSHEYHIVVLLLQTCSTYEHVYSHVWFCIYIYFLYTSAI
jgi:hypothetical protein